MSVMSGRLYGLRAGGNPLLQIATLLLLGVALIGAVVMGAVLLALFVGLAVIGAIVFSIRLWWLRRRGGPASGQQQRGHGELIEAEYRVIVERDAERQRRPD